MDFFENNSEEFSENEKLQSNYFILMRKMRILMTTYPMYILVWHLPGFSITNPLQCAFYLINVNVHVNK